MVSLLSHGASITIPNDSGQFPIHTAAESGDATILKALVVFGANLSMKNRDGDTPRHIIATSKMLKPTQRSSLNKLLHSVGAPRCSKREDCNESCKLGGHDDVSPDNSPRARDRAVFDSLLESAVNCSTMSGNCQDNKLYKVLSLDGGGIKGLIIIQMLIALEEKTGMPIKKLFDWIIGTSTGGILALGLSTGMLHPANHAFLILYL